MKKRQFRKERESFCAFLWQTTLRTLVQTAETTLRSKEERFWHFLQPRQTNALLQLFSIQQHAPVSSACLQRVMPRRKQRTLWKLDQILREIPVTRTRDEIIYHPPRSNVNTWIDLRRKKEERKEGRGGKH